MFDCLPCVLKFNHKRMIPDEKLLDYKRLKGDQYVHVNAII